LTVVLIVLLYSILSVQVGYSVHLTCIDSNYIEIVWLLCWLCYCTAYWV